MAKSHPGRPIKEKRDWAISWGGGTQPPQLII